MTEPDEEYNEIKTFEDIEIFAEVVDGKICVDFGKKGSESNAVLRIDGRGMPAIVMNDGSTLKA